MLHCAYGDARAGQQPGGARAFEVIFLTVILTADSLGGWTVPQRGGVWGLLCGFQGAFPEEIKKNSISPFILYGSEKAVFTRPISKFSEFFSCEGKRPVA